ncbi:MAG: recombinase family protein, partial [Flavobacterium sp.]
DRQKVNEKDFKLVVEDKCSGAIPFFERAGGLEIKKLVDKGILQSLTVVSIDRLGRNLRDVINTIHFFTERNIPIKSLTPSLCTLDHEGKEDATAKIMISILGILGEMERNQIRERQIEGIKLAKLRGVYKGRVDGSKEDTLAFLSKGKNKKALDYLKKGYKGVEAAKLAGVHLNTITKIKKMGLTK